MQMAKAFYMTPHNGMSLVEPATLEDDMHNLADFFAYVCTVDVTTLDRMLHEVARIVEQRQQEEYKLPVEGSKYAANIYRP